METIGQQNKKIGNFISQKPKKAFSHPCWARIIEMQGAIFFGAPNTYF